MSYRYGRLFQLARNAVLVQRNIQIMIYGVPYGTKNNISQILSKARYDFKMDYAIYDGGQNGIYGFIDNYSISLINENQLKNTLQTYYESLDIKGLAIIFNPTGSEVGYIDHKLPSNSPTGS